MPLRGDRRRWWHWPSWSFFPASLSSSPRRRRRRWRSRWKNVRRAWTALRSCTLDSSFAFTRMWMWQHSSWGTAGGGYQDESERGNYGLQLIHEMWFNSWTLCRMVEGEGRAPVTCHALPGIQCSHSCNETFTRFESNRNMNCEEEKSATSHQVWKLQLDQWIPLWHCASSLSLPRHVWCWQVQTLISVFTLLDSVKYFVRFYLGYPAIGLLKFSTLGFFFIGHLVCQLCPVTINHSLNSTFPGWYYLNSQSGSGPCRRQPLHYQLLWSRLIQANWHRHSWSWKQSYLFSNLQLSWFYTVKVSPCKREIVDGNLDQL